MPPFVLSRVSAAEMRGACGLIKRRWLHGSLKRQVIMMPAMSPLMTEGTITRWKIKEGDAFAAGDVLLQIESEIATIDVEAHSPGILGKILLPDGTTNVPVEQVIALVAIDMSEFAALQGLSTPILPSFQTIIPPSSPHMKTNSPKHIDQFNTSLLLPRMPASSSRTPSLFEMQTTMGYGFRGAHIGRPHGVKPTLDSSEDAVTDAASSEHRRVDVPPCPSPRIKTQDCLWSTSNNVQNSLPQVDDQIQIDGATIRRMIVSNLSHQSAKGIEYFDELVH